MAEKKSELDKLGSWIQSWPSSWYKNQTGKEMPKQPERESLAPSIYQTLTGKPYPKDPNPIISQRKKQAAPPQAAIPPVPKDPRGPGRLDDPIAGKGPKGNEVGSDHDPKEPGLQGPGDPKGPPTGPAPRVNSNGLVSYGKDLSSLNAFTSAFTGGYELTDIKSAFQSNDLEGAYQNGSNTISTDQSKYTLPDGATPSNVGGKYSMGDGDISIENTGYKIDSKSVPGTVGGNPADPQDGTSSKPDVAESIRQVRMARSEGSPRGFNGADFSGAEPDDSSLVSPMYANEKRNAIRNAFLDTSKSSVQASVAANAIAGYGKDSNADARFNVGGELVYAKDGMQQKAKNAAMMGRDPREFLDIPAASDTQPDTPAASEISMTAPIKDMTEDQQKKAAQEFAKGFVTDISGKLKDK